MDRQQLNIELQLKTCSGEVSKKLPIPNLVIDLSEDWYWHNCNIVRVIITEQYGDNILVLPCFLNDFLAKVNHIHIPETSAR